MGARCGPPLARNGGRRPRPAMAGWEIGEGEGGEEEEKWKMGIFIFCFFIKKNGKLVFNLGGVLFLGV